MKLSSAFSHWKQVRADLYSTIDRFSDSELTYIPFENAWSVGQIMLHIADAEEGWFRFVVKRELREWPDKYLLENYPTIEEIKGVLKDVHVRTEAYLNSLIEDDLGRHVKTHRGEEFTLGWIICHVLEHEIHHRGELSLILGLLGREGLDI